MSQHERIVVPPLPLHLLYENYYPSQEEHDTLRVTSSSKSANSTLDLSNAVYRGINASSRTISFHITSNATPPALFCTKDSGSTPIQATQASTEDISKATVDRKTSVIREPFESFYSIESQDLLMNAFCTARSARRPGVFNKFVEDLVETRRIKTIPTTEVILAALEEVVSHCGTPPTSDQPADVVLREWDTYSGSEYRISAQRKPGKRGRRRIGAPMRDLRKRHAVKKFNKRGSRCVIVIGKSQSRLRDFMRRPEIAFEDRSVGSMSACTSERQEYEYPPTERLLGSSDEDIYAGGHVSECVVISSESGGWDWEQMNDPLSPQPMEKISPENKTCDKLEVKPRRRKSLLRRLTKWALCSSPASIRLKEPGKVPLPSPRRPC